MVDAQMADWDVAYNAETEAANREIEARIDALSHEIDVQVDAAYGDGMERHFEDVSQSIETLALSCRDAELAPGETRILSRETSNGQTLRVAWVEGDEFRLHAPETLATIKQSDRLCDTEKEAFTSKLASRNKIEISKHSARALPLRLDLTALATHLVGAK